MDILGYRSIVHDAAKQSLLPQTLTALRGVLQGTYQRLTPRGGSEWVLKTFTDNIVLGWPIFDDGEGDLWKICLLVADHQRRLAEQGFFVRGAISAGDLYMDNDIVFGPALLEAHDLETEKARDPRIILSPAVVTNVERYLSYSDPKDAPQNAYILVDADGQYFVDYLGALIASDPPIERRELEDALLAHKCKVEESLAKHGANPNIWSKYDWAARYHNYCAKQLGCKGPKFAIQERYAMEPRKLWERARALS